MSKSNDSLFSALQVNDVRFRNRIGVSPMCQYSSENGFANDWHLVQLGSRAVGGAGLVIAEATAVLPEGRITPGCAGLWEDAQVEPLHRITQFLKLHGAVAGIQIGHAGRKASAARPWEGGAHLVDENGGWPIVGPSDQAFDQDGTRLHKAPTAMSKQDIKTVQMAFVSSAQRALAAGYDLLEIHGAHGYLLHSFFTPLVNQRDDEYGGELANRARMMLETVDAVRAVWPENKVLAVRLSVADWVEGGLSCEDNIQMAVWLKERGVDFIDCSSGGASPAARSSMGDRTAEQVNLAGQLRSAANIRTMAVGEIKDAHFANQLIASGTADIALMARHSLFDPYWPIHAAKELGRPTFDLMPIQNGFFVGNKNP